MTDFGTGSDLEEPNNAGLDEIAGNAPAQPTNDNPSQQDQPQSQPQEAEPQPVEPQPQEPQPVEPQPVEHQLAEPQPTEPQVTEPQPAEPLTAATQPQPPAPADVLPADPTPELPVAGEQGVEETPTGAAVSAEAPTGPAGEADHAEGEASGGDGTEHSGRPQGAPRRGGQRAWRPPRMSKEEMREIWTELQAKRDASEEIQLEVVGHNRGGVVTQYKGLEVFVPMSHWSLERQNASEPGDVKVGSSVPAHILEITDFETDARRVTATRRGTLRKNMLHAYEVGQHLTGTVASIHDFGIFVDLGGIDGLVHASEISHLRGKHPSELVKMGDSVDVVVKEIDPQRERIYLGMRELGPSPWDQADEKYPAGSIVEGRVSGFSKNGAFVELEPGIEGFIRMRELSWTKRVQRPKDVLKKSAVVPVKILEINGRRQRLSLSYRLATEDPWPQIAEKYAVGTNWKGAITELSNKGVVVDLGEVEGFLPRGRMGREARRLPDMKQGEELEVTVIEVDAARNSLIFGLAGQDHGAGRREGGERGERGERSERGGPRGDRPDRGDRGDRRERRDRGDRGGFAPPARPVDEIKSAETVGNFSLGDLLGDQIKSKLGVKQEKPRREPKPQEPAPGEATTGESTPATEPAADLGGGPAPAMFNQPLDAESAAKAELPLQSEDATDALREMTDEAAGKPVEPTESPDEPSNPPTAPESAEAAPQAEEAPEPEKRDPDFAAGDQDTSN